MGNREDIRIDVISRYIQTIFPFDDKSIVLSVGLPKESSTPPDFIKKLLKVLTIFFKQ